ncbi:cell division protein FtsQ/DivIB [Bacillus alveayuensis]|uniref:cell division protein FtsQ/DivIB n=1 Tax=Aeribacillus alveayuensis TaxID=279215 RepID=UPI0005D0F76C|nr:cell division protein FtsQ/DivIB [Bacillus alveayuensis]
MEKKKVVVLEERVPQLKQRRRQKTNRRLIGYIVLFFILILCIIYFQSPLSNIKYLEVEGNKYVSDKEILELSGLTTRTSFWKIKDEVVKKQISSHPEIASVQLQKHFPNKVILVIKERKRVAYILDKQKFLPVLENGVVLTDVQGAVPNGAPILVKWKKGEDIQEMVAQLIELPSHVLNAISEIHHTPTEHDYYHLTVFMNDGYEVSATVRNFAKKMSLYPSIVSQLDGNVRGVIHLEVSNYFKAYPAENEKKEGDDNEENTR